MAKEQRGSVRREDAVENFLTDESSSDDNHIMESQLPNGGNMLSSDLSLMMVDKQ